MGVAYSVTKYLLISALGAAVIVTIVGGVSENQETLGAQLCGCESSTPLTGTSDAIQTRLSEIIEVAASLIPA